MKLVLGQRTKINDRIVFLAKEVQPSLIIDCANIANPHRYFPELSQEDCQHIYMIITESLYRYRYAVQQIPQLIHEYGFKRICISSPDRLFVYDDEQEIREIHLHVNELLRSYTADIHIAIPNKLTQYYGTHSMESKSCS